MIIKSQKFESHKYWSMHVQRSINEQKPDSNTTCITLKWQAITQVHVWLSNPLIKQLITH